MRPALASIPFSASCSWHTPGRSERDLQPEVQFFAYPADDAVAVWETTLKQGESDSSEAE